MLLFSYWECASIHTYILHTSIPSSMGQVVDFGLRTINCSSIFVEKHAQFGLWTLKTNRPEVKDGAQLSVLVSHCWLNCFVGDDFVVQTQELIELLVWQ